MYIVYTRIHSYICSYLHIYIHKIFSSIKLQKNPIWLQRSNERSIFLAIHNYNNNSK